MSISRAIKSLIECGLIAKADLADFAGKKYIKNQNCYQLLFSNKNILVTKLDQYQNDTSTSNKMTSSTSNKSILKPSIYKPSYKPSIKNNKKDSDICKKVIDYLNQIAKTNYKSNSKQTRSLIQARIKEGFTLEDFIQVINNKTKQWISNPEMVAYLRPQTLFGTKMEAYLNEPKAKSRLDNIFGDI
ncbi:conserved phage C-terminal domain-containing protein [Francisella philomiragia]|uniref:Conserved phage C-terminal domain-containing protein n=2 Tax=Francisella philomiragia TaxID=28110 RepID=A0ABS1GAE9_9GAMM|nr:conserved phage C-terminal domain-containing protein [Francisella philomiragia]MBK2301784.1 conserved phage C-terminal domain-containing protein [Francisella philomiragia]